DSSVPRLARVLDDRYHQAHANVATITGITTTSMIAVELIRRSRSAAAIGPFGSRMPPEQPPSAVAPTKAGASTAYRISDSSASRQLRELQRPQSVDRGGPVR